MRTPFAAAPAITRTACPPLFACALSTGPGPTYPISISPAFNA